MIITLIPGPEFKRCSAACLTVDRRIHRKHVHEIREREKELLTLVRRNVLATPARTGQHTGLRRDIAAGTHARGIGDGSMYWSSLSGSRAIIPAGMDTLPGWTHPVFGKSPFVFQKGGFNWFSKPLMAAGQVISSDIDAVNEDEAEFIASHGA